MAGKFTDKFKDKKSSIESLKAKKPESEQKGDDAKSSEPRQDKRNFMDHLVSSRGDLCFKIIGKDTTGRVAWYYVLIDKEKKEAFLKHETGDSYDIKDYGKILDSGYGEEPPESVKQSLKDKYGFDNI